MILSRKEALQVAEFVTTHCKDCNILEPQIAEDIFEDGIIKTSVKIGTDLFVEYYIKPSEKNTEFRFLMKREMADFDYVQNIGNSEEWNLLFDFFSEYETVNHSKPSKDSIEDLKEFAYLIAEDIRVRSKKTLNSIKLTKR